jgi:hypothetical protein
VTPRTLAPVGEEEIRHGYTLTDLHQLTKLAVNTAKGWLAMDYTDLMEAAWFGISEHLIAAEHWPPRHDLVRAGQRAVNTLVTDEMHHAGYFKYKSGAGYGPGTMPAFVQFWHSPPTAIEPRIVERVTLTQIWPALTPRQREALAALAAHGDYLLAAESLGIEPQTYRSLLGRARREFLRLWHEHEVPSRQWGTDRRVGVHGQQLATHCSRGHEWTPENTHTRRRMVRGKVSKRRVCRACEHDRSVERARVAREARQDQPSACGADAPAGRADD